MSAAVGRLGGEGTKPSVVWVLLTRSTRFRVTQRPALGWEIARRGLVVAGALIGDRAVDSIGAGPDPDEDGWAAVDQAVGADFVGGDDDVVHYGRGDAGGGEGGAKFPTEAGQVGQGGEVIGESRRGCLGGSGDRERARSTVTG